MNEGVRQHIYRAENKSHGKGGLGVRMCKGFGFKIGRELGLQNHKGKGHSQTQSKGEKDVFSSRF